MQQTRTGQTSFKILPAFRFLAKQIFYNISHGQQSYVEPESTEQAYTAEQQPRPKNMKARKDQLSERSMSMEDRLAFLAAKRKELESFFQNDVWELVYDDGAIPADRILRAHFILKWTKWPSGEPRAKARLITQGFRDPDNFVFLTLFTLAVALMANRMWYLMTTSWTRRMPLTMPPATQSKNDTMDSHAQSDEDRPLLTLVELRRREKVLEDENTALRSQVLASKPKQNDD